MDHSVHSYLPNDLLVWMVVVGATMLHRCSARFRPALPRWGKVLRSEVEVQERPPQMGEGLTCGQFKHALREGGPPQMGEGLTQNLLIKNELMKPSTAQRTDRMGAGGYNKYTEQKENG